MRKLCAFVIAAGFAFGLVALGAPASTSMARVQVPDSRSAGQLKAQSQIVLVQSRRQRREIDEFLDRYSFDDPEYVQRERPSLFVEACRNKKKYLLMFSDNGDYFGRRSLGVCDERPRAVSIEELRDWLEDRNYTSIRFTDSTPPNRVADACRNKRRYTIRFDARGKATEQRRWLNGRCDDDDDGGDLSEPQDPDLTMSKKTMRTSLRTRGYRKVRFDRYFDESKLAEACQGVRKFRLFLDGRARVRARRAVGFCKANKRYANLAPPRPDLDSIDTESNTPIEPEKCQEILNWLQYRTPILFESSDDEVRDESRPLLRTIAQSVDRCPRTRLRIEGHTDSIGPTRFNQKLSAKRAEAVRRFLVRRNVPRRRIRTKGYGEEHPITGNLVEKDRARNRRIDLVLEWGRSRDLGLARSTRDDR
ncbi:MAG: OmpA family protein [Hyphomicrobiaceae bacterium]